jgi:GGDEF domain-containing protein
MPLTRSEVERGTGSFKFRRGYKSQRVDVRVRQSRAQRPGSAPTIFPRRAKEERIKGRQFSRRMLSFKKYLNEEKDDMTSWLVRIVMLLLEATALHAIDYDPDELVEFRRQIRQTIEKFEQTTVSHSTLIIAGEAVRSLQIYNQSVERFIRNVGAEKQTIIAEMTEAFLKLAHASELSGQNLRRIEKDLAKACKVQDLRLLKSKMHECLETISQEAARQEERARELKAPGTNLIDAPARYDQLTGLPTWQHAEARIKEIIDGERPGYVLVMVVKNLDSVNRRVGFAVGDQILTLIGQSVGRHLSGADQLFRWRGPCFVAVIERSKKYDHVLAEAAKIGSISLEKEIEAQGRSMFFKAAMAWTLLRFNNTSLAVEISKQIDEFAAEPIEPKPGAR